MKREILKEKKLDSLLVTHLPNVHYLTGFTGSAGCVLITPRQKLFFTDFRYRDQAAREVKGYRVVIVPGSSIDGAAAYAVKKQLKLGVLGYEAERISQAQYQRVRRRLKGVSFKDAGGAVERVRRIKSAVERRRIRSACEIADAAFSRLRRTAVIGKTEEEVAWFLESAMHEAGSGPLPFPVIVASGPRSAMPHGVASGRVIGRGELVVIDMGASVGGYCSDITRTFATGKLPSRLSGIYQVVKEAQELATAAVRPGAACSELDRLARGHITAAGFGKDFGHSLGHGVGLEPHEGPVLASRSKDILEAGMAVTVEPGIYLTGAGGVRIEDTLMVGRNAATSLTGFPRELIILK